MYEATVLKSLIEKTLRLRAARGIECRILLILRRMVSYGFVEKRLTFILVWLAPRPLPLLPLPSQVRIVQADVRIPSCPYWTILADGDSESIGLNEFSTASTQ